MLHRFIDNPETKSRFRILKGGRISLVVSALLVSASPVLHAATITISDANTTGLLYDGNTTSIHVTDTGSITAEFPIESETGLSNNNFITIDGDINASNDSVGILVAGNIENASFIENSGNMLATHYAVYVQGSLSGSIINNAGATISSEKTTKAVSVYITDNLNTDGSIVNSGTLQAIAAISDAYGIYIKADMNGSITNNTGAIISAESTGKAYGIKVKGNTYGTITNNAGATISAESNTSFSFSIAFSSAFNASSTLVNSGTIKGTSTSSGATGILFDGSMYGSLTNNVGATISADSNLTAYAIFTTDMKAGASLENSGTIQAVSTNKKAFAVYVDGDMSGTITNNSEATISAESNNNSGDAANGIFLNNGMETDGSLVNSGTIQATSTGNGSSHGIYLKTNMDGTITNNAEATISAESNSSTAFGINFKQGMETNSSLVNSGTITANSTSGKAYGIYSASTNNIYGSITNNVGGVISAESDSGLAHGVNVYNIKSSAAIVNSGTIKATSTSDIARGIFISNNMYGSITNNAGAIISAESDSSYAFGINFTSGMETNSSLVNSGTITANSTSGTSYGVYFGGNMDGTITNNGTISATKNSILDKSSYAILEDSGTNAGTILNSSTGKLYGNIMVNGNGLLTNSGLISLPYNANGASSATIANFTQTSTGTLQLGVNTPADANLTNNYSQLTTTNATFEDGSTIDILMTSSSGITDGTILTDVVSATDLNISGTLNITDTLALVDFTYVEDGETIDLKITRVSVGDAVADGGGSTSTQEAGNVLENDAGMSSIMDKLNTLETSEEVAQAVESTTPTVAASTVGASTQIANGIRNIINSRQNTMSGSGLNSGEALLSDKNVWIKPYVSFGSQNDKDGISGFGLRAAGFGIGVDGEYATKQRVDVAFFYTKAKVDTNNVSQNSELDILNLLVYGSMPLIDDKTTFAYQAGYGRQSTSSTRDIFNSTQATADYTTQTASLDLQLMRNFQVNDNFVVEPTIGTTYRYTNTPSYTESGAGVLNLSTDKFTANDFTANAGVLTNYKASKDIYLLANANLRYDLNNQTATVTSAYTGSSGTTFSTDGIDNGRLNYELGTGVNIQEVLGGEISFMYNYQAKGSDFSNNIVSARYMYSF